MLSLVGGAVFIQPLHRGPQIEHAPVFEFHSDSVLGIRDAPNLTFAADPFRLAAIMQAMYPYDTAYFGHLLTPRRYCGKGGNAGDAIAALPPVLSLSRPRVVRMAQLNVVRHFREDLPSKRTATDHSSGVTQENPFTMSLSSL